MSSVQIRRERLGLNHPTYIKELKASIHNEFKFSQNAEFDLARVLRDGIPKIPDAQWSTVIHQLAKENPFFEILIKY